MTARMPIFRELGVSDAVVETLAARGIVAPFPIQAMVIEDATSGRDTLAKSKTGSGKTLGFAIPIVEQLDPDGDAAPEALVLVPTRELAHAGEGGLRRHREGQAPASRRWSTAART